MVTKRGPHPAASGQETKMILRPRMAGQPSAQKGTVASKKPRPQEIHRVRLRQGQERLNRIVVPPIRPTDRPFHRKSIAIASEVALWALPCPMPPRLRPTRRPAAPTGRAPRPGRRAGRCRRGRYASGAQPHPRQETGILQLRESTKWVRWNRQARQRLPR